MELTERGESRVRGYLFILERSLKTFLSAADAADASREVESHIRERIAESYTEYYGPCLFTSSNIRWSTMR